MCCSTNQASVSIVSNRDPLTNVKRPENQIVLNGVQSDAKGVRVNEKGHFNEMGNVYYSEKATANILSFAAMVDGGAQIRYNQRESRFPYIQKEAITYTAFADGAFQGMKDDSTYVM